MDICKKIRKYLPSKILRKFQTKNTEALRKLVFYKSDEF